MSKMRGQAFFAYPKIISTDEVVVFTCWKVISTDKSALIIMYKSLML